MQILIQVICKKGPSLREKIVKDAKLARHSLKVTEERRSDRPRAWAKIHSTEPDRRGAINVQWNADAAILLARVITRGGNAPGPIVADFIDFLMTRLARRIACINVIPRR